jgi:hypothetical protein
MAATFENREKVSGRRLADIFGQWLTTHWQKTAITTGIVLLFAWIGALLWLLTLLLY